MQPTELFSSPCPRSAGLDQALARCQAGRAMNAVPATCTAPPVLSRHARRCMNHIYASRGVHAAATVARQDKLRTRHRLSS